MAPGLLFDLTVGVTVPARKPYNPYMQDPTKPQVSPAPTPAPAPPASITTVGPDGQPLTLAIPRSRAEVQELMAQRSELSDQLSNVASRRRNLAQEISTQGNDAVRGGLEQRLAVLDRRILQIETDLAITGRQLSSAPAELVEYSEAAHQGSNDDDFEEGMLAGGLPVLFIATIVFFFSRRRWKRRAALPASPGGESAQRLERLEHGMDAIALEIERISEGQRFVTRLLSDAQPALGQSNRLAPPVAAEREDPVKR